ncbi:MAG: hemerythrin [Candidatus Hydrogenedentota bacterium]|nr:MAG: hemerythrin [Candidatus Hydrogenedentota bacterium]
MMKAGQVLVEEHKVILKVLDCLEKVVRSAEEGEPIEKMDVEEILDFVRNFADKTHHAKEEDRLFVVMEEHGFSRQMGPTGVMLSEHTMGRRCVKEMAEALSGAAEGDGEQRRRFCESARAFLSLLRNHIAKEDHCLFPMAENALAPEERERLYEDFVRIEREAGGKRHEIYIGKAEDLCKKFGVDFDKEEVPLLFKWKM